ncbi:PP2C family protein-serine/threonine phosphatase [Acidovorax cavernicola]|uniref:Serine/threonine-protein phosphatase n=1 Tax=Acidovorax cavernicola TaxID=1675792 RepID=A0A9X8CZZ4_9BURK|nr:protein phosphatase 2C domain-containing protein [Acidovorax cavernicola]RIX74288.1 serine/threonine-protein phosphatase [Acidovorax cavernicola]
MPEATRAFAVPISTSQFSCVGERSGNQDAIGYHVDDHFACFVVSDGVGGTAGGELAARTAVDTMLNAAVDVPSITDDAIQRYVNGANSAILAKQRELTAQHKMSATVVALFIDRDTSQARWAHAGDSRLYRYRRGLVIDQTEDHSLARRAGHANTAAQTGPLVASNLLYRALGARHELVPALSPVQTLADGDAFLLCTDGLWQRLSQPVMERCLQLAASAEEWLALLRRAAETRGGEESGDNYSALAVWVGAPQQVTLAAGAG